MDLPEPLTTYLELRESDERGEEAAGLSHSQGGLVLLHVLEVAAHGEPRGAVTIVHGAGDHGGRYVAAAHRIAAGRWAVALPDLRGHGRSEGERGHGAGPREVLRDLGEIQRHLAYRLPTAPRVLVGQGLGGLYALHYALEKPGELAALVLLAPTLEPSFELPEAPGGLFKRFKKLAPNAPGKLGVDAEGLTGDPDQQRAWREDGRVHGVITLRAGRHALELAQAVRRRAGELAVPALLLHGADDPLADPAHSRALAAAAPPGRVELRELPGRRHDLLHERGADELADEIRGWLEANVPP